MLHWTTMGFGWLVITAIAAGCGDSTSATAPAGTAGSGTDASSDASKEGGLGPCKPIVCGNGIECGQAPDGCGGVLQCPSCASGKFCGGEGPNKCGSTPCKAKDCAKAAAQCGPVSDGCSSMIDCGPCPAGQGCENNKCVCKPGDCAGLGLECGSGPNGCGGTLQCPACPGSKTCSGNTCVGGSCGTCASGQWCNDPQCQPCDTALHCGPGCTNCPAQGTNKACIGGAHCGCNAASDCAAGSVCNTGTQECCVPNCAGKCGGSNGCESTCTECAFGQWCNGGTCQACNSDSHCGSSCVDCTAQSLDKVCTNSGACGCNSTADCGGSSTCNLGSHQCCAPSCAGKCGGPDGCGGTCPTTCPAGQWCDSGNCAPCNTAAHCGASCITCATTCTAGICDPPACSGCCPTSALTMFHGQCGDGVSIELPAGCSYKYEWYDWNGYDVIGGDETWKCVGGVWEQQGSTGDGAPCSGCPPQYRDVWTDTCGNISGKDVTCPK